MEEDGRQRALEYWLEESPRRGPPPQKTLHWEVIGRPPGNLETKEWLLRGKNKKRKILPWPKAYLRKEQAD